MNMSKKVNLEYTKDTENLYDTELALTNVCQFGCIRRKTFVLALFFIYLIQSAKAAFTYLVKKPLIWADQR